MIMSSTQKKAMYTYQVRVVLDLGRNDATAQLSTIRQVTDYVNEVFGYEVMSVNMVYNYLTRRHLSNKRLFDKKVFVSRTRNNQAKQTSSCPKGCSHQTSDPAGSPGTACA